MDQLWCHWAGKTEQLQGVRESLGPGQLLAPLLEQTGARARALGLQGPRLAHLERALVVQLLLQLAGGDTCG